MIAPRLGGERGRAGRQRRPGAEQLDRDAVGAVAPVDEQREDLLALEHREQPAQVPPRDDVDAPRLALAAEELEQLRERGVVGDHADRVAAARRSPAATASLLPTWPGDDDHRPPGGAPALDDAVDALRLDASRPAPRAAATGAASARRRSGAYSRYARSASRRTSRVIGRQAQHVPEVDVREPPLGRPREVAGLVGRADHRPREARRHMREDGRRALVGDDGRPFDDAGRGRLEAPMGRLQLSPGSPGGGGLRLRHAGEGLGVLAWTPRCRRASRCPRPG